ncbi:MAG TPA: Ig-like domain-containing protein [Gemmatimonadales bacterium]
MNRFALRTALVAVTLLVACQDELAPPTHGSITIVIGGGAIAPQVTADDRTGTRHSGISAAVAAFDAVQLVVTGPTNRTVQLQLSGANWTGRADSLLAGDNYAIKIRATTNGDLSSFGSAENITVTAGRNTEVPVSNWGSVIPNLNAIPPAGSRLSFGVSYSAIAAANNYRIEYGVSEDFAGARSVNTDSTGALITVSDTGTYNVRVRATVDGSVGAPSEPRTVSVEGDQRPTGDNAGEAATLGFGNGANGTIANLNITSGDQDWFAITVCQADTVILSTRAAVLNPPSTLNTRLRLYNNDGSTLIAENDDDGVTTDSRIEAAQPADDDVKIQVTGVGSSTGHYELVIDHRAGPNNTGTACLAPTVATVQVSPSTASFDAVGNTVQLTAVGLDAGGNPVSGATFDWQSDDSGIADVSTTGLVTSTGNGTAIITATSVTATAAAPASGRGPRAAVRPGKRATPDDSTEARLASGPAGSATITVAQVATAVSVAPTGTTITSPGGNTPFTVDARDANDNPIPSPAVVWSSINPAVATMGAGGTAAAVSSGQSIIRAEVDGIAAYATLTVALPQPAVNIWSGDSVVVGGGGALRSVWAASPTDVYAAGSDGAFARFDGTSWSTSDNGVTDSLGAIWGTGASNVLAVGQNGLIVHFDGTVWDTLESGTNAFIRGIWGGRLDQVWGLGAPGEILRGDLTTGTWTIVPLTGISEQLWGIWGSAPNNIYAVGEAGRIMRFNGTQWGAQASPTAQALYSVWGTDSSNVYAVGTNGTVLHRGPGGPWTVVTSGTITGSTLWGVGGVSTNDIYAVGGGGTALRYDGASWSAVTTWTSAPLFHVAATDGRVFATGGTDVVLVQRGTRNGAVLMRPVSDTLSAIGDTLHLTGTAVDAVGDTVTGTAFTWATSDETVVSVSPTSGLALTGVATGEALGEATITATAPGGAQASAVITVTPVAVSVTLSPGNANLLNAGATQAFSVEARDAGGNIIPSPAVNWLSRNTAVATVSAAGVVTAVAAGQVIVEAEVTDVRGYGLATVVDQNIPAPINLWQQQASPYVSTHWGVWGTSVNDVVVVSNNGLTAAYDGTTWTETPNPVAVQLRRVWGASAGEVWGVGASGTVIFWNGSSWSTQASGTSAGLNAVWGSSPANVIAVGTTGTILRWDGTSWQSETSGTTAALNAVWGVSPDTVFAVGGSGTILRYDGADWTAETSGVTDDLIAVWGTASDNVFAAGGAGRILHYDGIAWSSQTSGVGTQLRTLWGTSNNEVFAAGTSGVVLRYDGTGWSPVSTPVTDTFFEAWGTSPSDIFVVGGSSALLRGVRGATVTITPTDDTLAVIGDTLRLVATAQESGGAPVDSVTYDWSSSDDAIATVDANGLVTAVNGGTVVISATARGGAVGTATVFVQSPAGLVKVGGDDQNAPINTTLPAPLVVQVNDANGDPLPGASVTWAVATGGGGVTPSASVTDAGGQASTAWTLGPTLGTQQVTASADGFVVTFTANALTGIFWLGGSGDWSVGTNWSTGVVPGLGDTVFISVDGDYTVTLDVDASAARLIVGAASGTQLLRTFGPALTVSERMAVVGGGSLLLSGATANIDSLVNRTTTTLNGTDLNATWINNIGSLTVGVNGLNLDVAGNLENRGSIALDSGAFVSVVNGNSLFLLGSALTLRATATLDFTNHVVVSEGPFAFDSSTVLVDGGSVSLAGAFTVGPTATLDLTAAAISADTVINDGTISMDGSAITAVVLHNGFLSAYLGTNALNGGFVTDPASSVEVSEIGTVLTVDAGFTNAGNITLTATGCCTDPRLVMSSGTLINTGTIDVSGAAGGTIEGALDNQGNVNSNATEPLTLTGTTISNSGSFNAETGDLSLTGGGTFTQTTTGDMVVGTGQTVTVAGGTFANSGLVHGTGTLDVSGAVFTSDGVLAPGASPGTLTIQGSVTMTGGALELELDGLTPDTQHDVLAVSDTITLAGAIDVIMGFTPAYGDEFTVVTFGHRIGGFSDLASLEIGGGRYLQPGFFSDRLTLSTSVPQVVVTPDVDTLVSINETTQLTAEAQEFDGTPIVPGPAFTWSSGNEAIATVDANGLVTAVGVGSTGISATATGGTSGGAAIVVDITISAVTISPAGVALAGAGATTTLSAEVLDGMGNPTGAAATWSSLNPQVATVDPVTGQVTVAGHGQVTIAAAAGGVTGYATVTASIPGSVPVNLWAMDSTGVEGLNGIWGTSASNILVGGNGATMVRFDGAAWSAEAIPTSNISDLWGTSDSDIVATSLGGSVMRYDGSSWGFLTGAPSTTLNDIWAASPVARWIVGADGTIAFHDGTGWTTQTSGTPAQLRAVWGASATDVFAVGADPSVFHTVDGIAWTPMTSASTVNLEDVWGTSATDVWVIGDTAVLHYDGVGSPDFDVFQYLPGPLYAIWGSAPDDIYVSAEGNRIHHYDGVSWKTDTVPETHFGLWGAPQSPVFAVGRTGTILRGYRGASVTVLPDGATLAAVGDTLRFIASVDDAAANPITSATVTWRSLDEGIVTIDQAGLITTQSFGVADITATAPGGAADTVTVTVMAPLTTIELSPVGGTIVAAGGTQQFTAAGIDAVGDTVPAVPFTWTTANPTVATVDASGLVTAANPGQTSIGATGGGITGYATVTVAFAPAAGPINLWEPEASGTTVQLNSVHAFRGGDAWVAMNTTNVLQFSALTWNELATGLGFGHLQIWGSSASDIYTAGPGGRLGHYDGSTWSTVQLPTANNLTSVWGVAPDHVVAVGELGTIGMFDGTTWNTVSSGTTESLTSVWGYARDRYFAVGVNGTLLRYDGTSWNVELSTGPTYTHVWGFDSTDVYASVGGGLVVHFDGVVLDTVHLPSAQSFISMTGTTGTDLYFAGGSGRIARFDGATLFEDTLPIGTTPLLDVVTIPDRGAYVVGGGGTIYRGYRNASVTVTPDLDTLPLVGDTVTLFASAVDGGGNPRPAVEFTWDTDDPAIATVDATGLVTAAGSGTTLIIATVPGGAADTATIVVLPQVVAVSIAPTGVSLSGIGANTTLTAYVIDNMGDTVALPVTWSSLNATVATIDGGGLVTSAGDGQAVVSAAASGFTGYAVVTVANPATTPVNLWDVAREKADRVIFGIWGLDAGNVLALPSSGDTILRYDGTTWTPVRRSSVAMFGAWASTPDDVWVIGDNGSTEHYDGTSWASGTTAVDTSMRAMWGSAPNDIWAVGLSSTIQHYDGVDWTDETVTPGGPSLQGIWGSARDTVWAVGNGGTILRYDGSAWSTATSPTGSSLFEIWGSAGNDIWAVGAAGTIIHYDGALWSDVTPVPALPFLSSVWGSASNDVWAAGTDSTIVHYNGATWDTVAPKPRGFGYGGVWGRSTGDMWVIGTGPHFILRGVRGGTVSVTPADPTITALGDTVHLTASAADASANALTGVRFTWSSSDEGVATVDPAGIVTALANGIADITATAPGGASGSIAVTVQQVAATLAVPGSASISGVGSTHQFTVEARDANDNLIVSPTTVWTSFNPAVATVNGSSGLVSAVASGQTTVKVTVDGIPGHAVVNVSVPGITPVNLWAEMPTPATFVSVWGKSASDMWAVGPADAAYHFDGTNWIGQVVTGGGDLADVWGVGSELFAAGRNLIAHFDGSTWTTEPIANILFEGVWGTSPTDVFAVGQPFNGNTNGIYHFNGASWSPMVAPGGGTALHAVWGTSSSNVFAAGTGLMLHFDGSTWTQQVAPNLDYRDLWGPTPNDVYAVAGGNLWGLAHWDGFNWSAVPGGPNFRLNGVHGTSSSDINIVGGAAALFLDISQFDGSVWTSINVVGGLFEVWTISSSDVFAVGPTSVRGYRGAAVTIIPTASTVTLPGDTLHLAAEARDNGDALIPTVTFAWSSLDEGVATVDPATGIVTAEGPGTVGIIAAAPGGAADTMDVFVPTPTSIVVSPAGGRIDDRDLTESFSAIVLDEFDNPMPGAPVTWSARNPFIATIDAAGTVTGVGAGQTIVEAAYQGAAGHAVLTTAVQGATPVNLWAEMVNPEFGAGQIWRVRATGNGDEAWAFGQGGALRFNGTDWVDMGSPAPTYGGRVLGPDDVWATGNAGMLYHWDGSTWNPVQTLSATNMYAFWASSPTDMWASGESDNVVEHWDGTAWSTVALPAGISYVWDIWGSDSATVFAAGNSGSVFQFDGSSWSAVPSGAVSQRSLWSPGGDSVIAVGEASSLVYLNSAGGWSTMTTPFTSGLYGVWGSAFADVYAVGSNGTVGRFDGVAWDSMPAFTTDATTWHVAGSPDGNIYAVTDGGRIYRGLRGGSISIALSDSIFPGDTLTSSIVTAFDSAGGVVDSVRYHWASLDPTVTTAFTNGVVALDTGWVDIVATAGGGAADTVTLRVGLKSANILIMGDLWNDNDYVRSEFGSRMPGITFDTLSTSTQTPTLAFLQTFDAVLMYMNGFPADQTAVGDTLAAYVGAGGNVIVATFYWQGGPWGAFSAIEPLVSIGGSRYVIDSVVPGAMAIHPLTRGLDTLYAFFEGGTTPAGDATVVASWNNGGPAMAYRVEGAGQRLLGISMFPAHGLYNGSFGDETWWRAWENALRWTSDGGASAVPGPALLVAGGPSRRAWPAATLNPDPDSGRRGTGSGARQPR